MYDRNDKRWKDLYRSCIDICKSLELSADKKKHNCPPGKRW